MKLKNFVLASVILLGPFINIFSQNNTLRTISDSTEDRKEDYIMLTIRNAPKLTVQFNFDYDFGLFELSANDNGDLHTDEFINGRNFGVRHGLGAGVTVKIPLHEQGKFRLNTSVMYNGFSSKFNKVFVSSSEYDYVKYDVISGSVGIENNFTPSFKVKAYIGIGIQGSVIYGSARITQENVPSEFKILPAFRVGLNLFSGLEYMVFNNLGFTFGLKITHANLWLKESKESGNPGEIYLNDKRVTNKYPFAGFRQFAWGSLSTGVNYYFGVKEKHYIFKKAGF
jgi:hypothetical protein